MIGAGSRPNSGPYRSTRPFGGGTTHFDVTLTSGLPSGGTRPEGVGVRRHGPTTSAIAPPGKTRTSRHLCFV